MKGLWAKLLGCIGFCLVYTYYYDYGGDTRGYFNDAIKLINSLEHGTAVFFEVLLRNYQTSRPEVLNILYTMTYKAPMEFYTVNLSSIFIILGFGSYFSASLLIALFSYWGIWSMFLFFVKQKPKLEKEFAISILFIPSVVFWGSGLSKDTFILCFIGLFLYHLNHLLSGRFLHPWHTIVVLLTGFLIFKIKAYVLLSLFPAILLWKTLYLRNKIQVNFLRVLALPFLALFGLIAIIYSLNYLGTHDPKYSIDNFMSSAQSMQGWHYVEGENTSAEYGRGSSYSLGEYDSSTGGLLKVFPSAVNVTLFRPYLWEVAGAAMLAQALESLVFMILSLYIIFKLGPPRFYKAITNDSLILMCLVFAVLFAFAVGFSAYNFGALSRYKIPCMPFFLAGLLMAYRSYLPATKSTSKLAQKPTFSSYNSV